MGLVAIDEEERALAYKLEVVGSYQVLPVTCFITLIK